MSRDRDPFERTLDRLRKGLRAGDHGLGQPLHIAKLAAALSVSATPVREALARLSGEGLIERAQSGYLTRVYDAVDVRELYRIDQIYVLAPSTGPHLGGAVQRPASVDDRPAGDHVARTEALLGALSAAHGRTLLVARQRVWDRLAMFRSVEPLVLPEVELEVARLDAALRSCERPPLALVRAYYRRRLKAAEALWRAAMARKYHSNIL